MANPQITEDYSYVNIWIAIVDVCHWHSTGWRGCVVVNGQNLLFFSIRCSSNPIN